LVYIKNEIFNDSEFIKEMREERGVDLIEKKANDIANYGGLDS
jgi:hypothetical protein